MTLPSGATTLASTASPRDSSKRSGCAAAAGRLLSGAEQQPSGPLAAVISDAFWRRNFTSDPSAVGSTVKFNDRIFTIVGVLPPGIAHPARADVYVPWWTSTETTSRSGHNYQVVARLRDGVSLESARAEMTTIARRLEQQYPQTNTGKLIDVVPLQELVVDGPEEYPLHAARRGWPGAADRLRQRRQPAAVARDRRASARWSCGPRLAPGAAD